MPWKPLALCQGAVLRLRRTSRCRPGDMWDLQVNKPNTEFNRSGKWRVELQEHLTSAEAEADPREKLPWFINWFLEVRWDFDTLEEAKAFAKAFARLDG
jgi:hypothetical protein